MKDLQTQLSYRKKLARQQKFRRLELTIQSVQQWLKSQAFWPHPWLLVEGAMTFVIYSVGPSMRHCHFSVE
jgi:hypothetical protein